MKILHITASPLIPQSGITAVLKGLVISLNNIDGIQSRVLSLAFPIKEINCQYFDELVGISFKEYVENNIPDLVIFHSFYQLEFVLPAIVLKNKGIPFVIEPHGSFGRQALKKSALKKWLCDKTIFHNLLCNARGYIFTNDTELKDSKYLSRKNTVIKNGVDEDIVINSSDLNKNSVKAPIIYFLGRYDVNHKGLDYLFDALLILEKKGVDDIEIRLYGTGNEEQKKYVTDRICEFKNIRIKDMGTIYGEEKKKALEDSHILILTSRYEGSPMTILDAWCYGNPCILTPGTNVAEEAEKYNLGWRTSLDPMSIADTIIRARMEYAKNPKLYVNNCKEHILDNYTWKNIAQKAIAEYTLLLG